MSLSYGNFSHPLNATVNSGIIASGTVCYFTLPWYPASYVERVRVQVVSGTAPGTYSQMDILANGAHERIGDFSSVDDYIYSDGTDSTVSVLAINGGALWNINNPVYVDNKYSRPYLHIKLTFDACTNAIFVLSVQGRKSISTSYLYGDNTGVKKAKSYRVLRSGTAGTIDVTNNAITNSNRTNNDFSLSNNSDYIMVGSINKVDHWDFGVAIGSTNSTTLIGEIYDGTNWKGITVLDNTGATSGTSMRYSGVVEGQGIGSSLWVPTKISLDPLTVYENSIMAGTSPPITFLSNPARYWARFKVTAITGDTIYYKYLLPVEDTY